MKYSGEFMQNLTTNESYTLKNTNDFPRPLRTFHQGIIVALCTSVLAGCQSIDQPPKLLDDGIRAAWVVVGYGNNTARVITAAKNCPEIMVDGNVLPMSLRAAATASPPRREIASPFVFPATFPVTSCEFRLPAQTKTAVIAGRTLPIPKRDPERILIIGDTGCRMSATAWQACNDPNEWPFAKVAALGATMKPELVLHLGDFHYRESPCPASEPRCQNSPWGYGWDAWDADFFTPADSLLKSAPWVMVRGNHEECERAGQGWFRFLDPDRYSQNRACSDPSQDRPSNYSAPYVVPIGARSQFIIFDSSTAGHAEINRNRPSDIFKFETYQEQFRKVADLANKEGVNSFFVSHHPVLGVAAGSKGELFKGNKPLLTTMKSLNGLAYFPKGITATFHGHSHVFEAMSYRSEHPATIIAGHGGTSLDRAIPDPLPPGTSPAEGVTVESITHSNLFGLLMMERHNNEWVLNAFDRDGKPLTTCQLRDLKVLCDKKGLIR
jgi:hypothetical protein